MAVYSMTGFASATAQAGADGRGTVQAESLNHAASATVLVELRSVNSRFLDLTFRMPDELRGAEPALRELLGAAFRRGKIDVRVASSKDTDTGWPQPQSETLMRLSALEAQVTNWLPQARPLSVNEALGWCRQGSASVRLDEALVQAGQAAVQGLMQARAREGDRLAAILQERIARLRELAAQAVPLVPAVVQRQQQRFLERWQEALSQAGAGSAMSADVLKERALNEAAAYALRIDVAEELARLGSHLDEITRLLASGGELGKRLDFMIQELHREANTLGAKSTALELSHVSVEMKVAIEQMREQVQNIE